eukprot:Gb_28224 [translate_table: standard]
MGLNMDLMCLKSSSLVNSTHSQRRRRMPKRKKVFNLVKSVGIRWHPSGSGYQMIQREENGMEKPKRRKLATVKLGNSRKSIMVRIYRRFRVRIFKGYCWALLKRLKAFYIRLLADMKEAAPVLDMISTNSLLNVHFSMAALPPTAPPSMAF